jgi:hypothetical protein
MPWKHLLKMILMYVLVPFLVLVTKMQQRIPLVAWGHAPNLNAHLPIRDNIDDVVKFRFWPASGNGGTLTLVVEVIFFFS